MRIELNLWDAKRLDMAGREITIDGPEGQVHIILPVGIELPTWGFVGDTGLTEEESELITGICNHHPFAHKISGGCTVKGCTCDKKRGDEPCDDSEVVDHYKQGSN